MKPLPPRWGLFTGSQGGRVGGREGGLRPGRGEGDAAILKGIIFTTVIHHGVLYLSKYLSAV